MRQIDVILNPVCTCTVFSANGKLILKCEAGPMEQVYKFSELEFSLGVIKEKCTEAFWQGVKARFDMMFAEMKNFY